jgi:hypothetical protein
MIGKFPGGARRRAGESFSVHVESVAALKRWSFAFPRSRGFSSGHVAF